MLPPEKPALHTSIGEKEKDREIYKWFSKLECYFIFIYFLTIVYVYKNNLDVDWNCRSFLLLFLKILLIFQLDLN